MEFSLDKIIDVKSLPENGVLVLKLEALEKDVIESLTKMGEQLKPALEGKNLCVFVMRTGETFESYTERDMLKYGYVKIEQSALNKSLQDEIKAGSESAIKQLAESLAEKIKGLL